MAEKKSKPWICNACRSKNPIGEGICQGCDLEKSRARIPRGKYYGLVRDADREPWSSFDVDGDGQLSPTEFERLYSLLRKPYFGDSLSVFKVFDSDGSGEIVRFHAYLIWIAAPLLQRSAHPPSPLLYLTPTSTGLPRVLGRR